MGYWGQWVYEFAGCPDQEDEQHIGQESAPGAVVLRERPGGTGVVDGYVCENLDAEMMVARFRWVASGNTASVTRSVALASSKPRPPSS